MDLLIYGFIAEDSGPFKFIQILLKDTKIWAAGGMSSFSNPQNTFLLRIKASGGLPPTKIDGSYDFVTIVLKERFVYGAGVCKFADFRIF